MRTTTAMRAVKMFVPARPLGLPLLRDYYGMAFDLVVHRSLARQACPLRLLQDLWWVWGPDPTGQACPYDAEIASIPD